MNLCFSLFKTFSLASCIVDRYAFEESVDLILANAYKIKNASKPKTDLTDSERMADLNGIRGSLELMEALRACSKRRLLHILSFNSLSTIRGSLQSSDLTPSTNRNVVVTIDNPEYEKSCNSASYTTKA